MLEDVLVKVLGEVVEKEEVEGEDGEDEEGKAFCSTKLLGRTSESGRTLAN
jgi:hypothetical protein